MIRHNISWLIINFFHSLIIRFFLNHFKNVFYKLYQWWKSKTINFKNVFAYLQRAALRCWFPTETEVSTEHPTKSRNLTRRAFRNAKNGGRSGSSSFPASELLSDSETFGDFLIWLLKMEEGHFSSHISYCS